MNVNTIIIRYSEIGIKGLNRSYFENRLINNIKDCLNKNNITYIIKKIRGRILIFTKNKCPKLKYIFGISSFSPATETQIEKINQAALSLIKKEKTFRITTKRIDKSFPKTSQQINEEVGFFIQKYKKIKVNLEKPEINIGIEIINNKAYIFNEKIKGLNGLPVTTEGAAYLRVKNKKRSLVAAFLILKRGSYLILSKKLPLKKFEYGFKFKIRKENKYDKVVVIDEINLNNIKKEKDKLVLSPLIGLSASKINKLYFSII